MPHKTHLTIIDPSVRKTKSYYFKDYSFYGTHDIAPELNLGVAYALNSRPGEYGSNILLIDLSKEKIIKTFNVPYGYRATILHKTKWLPQLFILLQTDNDVTALIKSVDLSNYTETNPVIIGNFSVKNALIHDTRPLLILDIIEANKNKLIIYNIENKNISNNYSTETSFIELKLIGNEIYGLLRLPGKNQGRLCKYSLEEDKENILCEFDGVPESMLFVKDYIYIIALDPKESKPRQNYWLHPRILYIYDINKNAVKDVFNWTMREGKLFGLDDKTNRLFFAVLDNDAPFLWFFNNDIDTLRKIDKIIK
jgi:hypothetical protein